MDIRKIIAQLFIIGFRGKSIDDTSPIVRDIGELNLGGIILFDRILSGDAAEGNIDSLEQIKILCERLQSYSKETLLIAVDQEGGKVQRIKEKHGFPRIPTAEELGREEDCRESTVHARQTGRILAEIGINCNFSPVADLNINPDNPIIGKIGRAFSNRVSTVTNHCEVWLDELHQSGIIGCLKHFPGHGSSHTDSHAGFVDISASWQRQELQPYSRLIAKNKVHAIMMGHLFHSGLDAHHPASISPDIIQGLLRREMKYEGLVITDDMQMKAITDRYGLIDAVVMAISAGVDMVIIGNNLAFEPDILRKAIDGVEKALNDGHLALHSITTAYQRIQHIKENHL